MLSSAHPMEEQTSCWGMKPSRQILIYSSFPWVLTHTLATVDVGVVDSVGHYRKRREKAEFQSPVDLRTTRSKWGKERILTGRASAVSYHIPLTVVETCC